MQPAAAAAAAALGWSEEPGWRAEILELLHTQLRRPPQPTVPLMLSNADPDQQRPQVDPEDGTSGVASDGGAASPLPPPGWSLPPRAQRRASRAARVRALRAAALDLSARVEMLTNAAEASGDYIRGDAAAAAGYGVRMETFISGGLPVIDSLPSVSAATSAETAPIAPSAIRISPSSAGPDIAARAVSAIQAPTGHRRQDSHSCTTSSSSRSSSRASAAAGAVQRRRGRSSDSSDNGIADRAMDVADPHPDVAARSISSRRRGSPTLSDSPSSSASRSPPRSRAGSVADSLMPTASTQPDRDSFGGRTAGRGRRLDVQGKDERDGSDGSVGSKTESAAAEAAVQGSCSAKVRSGVSRIPALDTTDSDDEFHGRHRDATPTKNSTDVRGNTAVAGVGTLRGQDGANHQLDPAAPNASTGLGGGRWPIAPFGPSDFGAESDDDQDWGRRTRGTGANDPFSLARILQDLKDREQQEEAALASAAAAATRAAEADSFSNRAQGPFGDGEGRPVVVGRSDGPSMHSAGVTDAEVSVIAARRRAIEGVLSPREVAALIARAENVLGTGGVGGGISSGMSISTSVSAATLPAVPDPPVESPFHFVGSGHTALGGMVHSSVAQAGFLDAIAEAGRSEIGNTATDNSTVDSPEREMSVSAAVTTVSAQGNPLENRASLPSPTAAADIDAAQPSSSSDTAERRQAAELVIPGSVPAAPAAPAAAGRAVPPPASHAGVWPDGGESTAANRASANRPRLAPAELQARLMAEVRHSEDCSHILLIPDYYVEFR